MYPHFYGDKPTEQVKVGGQEFTDNRGIIKYAKKRVKKFQNTLKSRFLSVKLIQIGDAVAEF